MSVEANVALVRRFLEEAWNRGDLAVIDETHTPTYWNHGPSRPGVMRTRDDLRRQITGMRADYPDLHIVSEDLIAADDKVVLRYALSGTHATKGRAIAITGVSIFRIEGGQVVEYWGHGDDLNRLRQLGDLPPAAPANP
jgi:predicted SnoaL-like aldol condensation-catalyzing enzyme